MQHGLQFVLMATVVGSDDVEVCRDADVLVLTAGVPPRPGQRRLDLAAGSVAICRDLLPRLLEVAPGAVLVIVTNPVDVVTYAALKIGGLPHHRVLGSGTVLESSRLRSLIARRCGVAVQNVHAYIAGEHQRAGSHHRRAPHSETARSKLPEGSGASPASASMSGKEMPDRSWQRRADSSWAGVTST